MNLSIELIALLTEQERQGFLNYLKRRNKRTDVRNVQLFKDLVKGQELRLKDDIGANAYNVLKKRLTDRLIEFTAECVLLKENTREIEIMKLITLSRRLFSHKAFNAAFKLMKTAEKKALKIQHFHLLNEIYQTLIEHSYHEKSPDQQALLKRFSSNKAAYENQSNLNMAYAVIRKQFHDHERHSTPFDLSSLIETNFKKFGVIAELGYNFKSLYQIAEMANISGALGKNYFGIDLYFENQVDKIQSGPLDTEDQLIYHIDLLYLIAHIYFRKKGFDQSLFYLNRMEIQMKRFNERFYALRIVKLKTLYALNHNFKGNVTEAKSALELILNSKTGQINHELLQGKLANIMIHIQQNELTNARKEMAELRQNDRWYFDNIGIEWLLNKKFIEIILHIELGSTSYVDARISSLMRKKEALFKGANAQALSFLKLVKAYHQNPLQVTEPEFIDTVERAFDWKPAEEEDLFFMSFYAWLKSKMTKEPLYETTLKLVRSLN